MTVTGDWRGWCTNTPAPHMSSRQFWAHVDADSQSPPRIKHQLPVCRGPENTSFIVSLPVSESLCPPPRNDLPSSSVSELGSRLLEDSELVLTRAGERAAVIVSINCHLLPGPRPTLAPARGPRDLLSALAGTVPPARKPSVSTPPPCRPHLTSSFPGPSCTSPSNPTPAQLLLFPSTPRCVTPWDWHMLLGSPWGQSQTVTSPETKSLTHPPGQPQCQP